MHIREKTASNKRWWKNWKVTSERMKLDPFPPYPVYESSPSESKNIMLKPTTKRKRDYLTRYIYRKQLHIGHQ